MYQIMVKACVEKKWRKFTGLSRATRSDLDQISSFMAGLSKYNKSYDYKLAIDNSKKKS